MVDVVGGWRVAGGGWWLVVGSWWSVWLVVGAGGVCVMCDVCRGATERKRAFLAQSEAGAPTYLVDNQPALSRPEPAPERDDRQRVGPGKQQRLIRYVSMHRPRRGKKPISTLSPPKSTVPKTGTGRSNGHSSQPRPPLSTPAPQCTYLHQRAPGHRGAVV